MAAAVTFVRLGPILAALFMRRGRRVLFRPQDLQVGGRRRMALRARARLVENRRRARPESTWRFTRHAKTILAKTVLTKGFRPWLAPPGRAVRRVDASMGEPLPPPGAPGDAGRVHRIAGGRRRRPGAQEASGGGERRPRDGGGTGVFPRPDARGALAFGAGGD